MAGDHLVKVRPTNTVSTEKQGLRDMAGDLITIVAFAQTQLTINNQTHLTKTQLTINNQTQGSLARAEDLRSCVKTTWRALPDVPLSQSSPNHASAEQLNRRN